MSHIAADKSVLFSHDNVSLPRGAGRTIGVGVVAVGVVCLAITAIAGFTAPDDGFPAGKLALASYHVGAMAALGPALGALVFVMILHQVNAGWSALIRRQFENVMSLIPLCGLLLLPVIVSAIISPGALWHWMDSEYVATDPLYHAKEPFLNVPFFIVRALLYFVVWTWLAWSLWGFSRRQDESGDKWLTAKARRRSSYGLLLFALTTAFAGFDWLMTLDYHWYSTMFGVYFFAMNIGAGLALTTFVLLTLRRAGRLDGLVTNEHFHDLGKLLFGFSVFWAYIGFSQYFLIWYGNIPEETAWYVLRRNDVWMPYSVLLAAGRFIVPFIVLMPRPWRRSPFVLTLMCIWILAMNVLDLFWVVRPQVHASGAPAADIPFNWLDAVAILGPVCLFVGALMHRVASGPLVPLKDPRLDESVHHKNYV